MKPPCSVEGCENTSLNKGLCNSHYKRFMRHGDPLAGGKPRRRGATCTVDGCDRPHQGHGYCQKHRVRWEKHGDPLFEGRSLAERFWQKVDVRGPDECWPWIAGLNAYGYGSIGSGGAAGRTLGAHRLSLELAGTEIPEGMFVLHSCDNPPCVNPAHLRVGTQTDNMQDAVRRGRLVHPNMVRETWRRTPAHWYRNRPSA